ELPTQVTSNLQAIQNAQVQLQTLAEAADRARERRLLLERQLAEAESEIAVIMPLAGTQAQNTPSTEPAEVQLQKARAYLQQQLTHYTPEHPDVKATQKQIRELEAKAAEEASKRPATSASTSTEAMRDLPAAERNRQQRIRDLRLQIADIDRQLTEKQEQE